MTRDVVATVTTSYQKASALADSDQNDVSPQWKNVTITNQTNVTIHIKNSGKSEVSGDGRTLLPTESFNYLEIDSTQLNVKAASSPTGKVVFSFQQG